QALRAAGPGRRAADPEGAGRHRRPRAPAAPRQRADRAHGPAPRRAHARRPRRPLFAGGRAVTYVAEPYAQFVDDLLTSFTGGVAREEVLFVPEAAPFLLAPPGPIVTSTLLVFGQSAGAYNRFRPDRDFTFTAEGAIQWKAGADGGPAAGAVWPDPGTPFFVNYDHRGPAAAAPLLTDRNPGSVTRLLAASVGREYAVLSRQLEAVYRAGFLDTAGGRDLEQLVALLGLSRRGRANATGTVVFARSTPATAD